MSPWMGQNAKHTDYSIDTMVQAISFFAILRGLSVEGESYSLTNGHYRWVLCSTVLSGSLLSVIPYRAQPVLSKRPDLWCHLETGVREMLLFSSGSPHRTRSCPMKRGVEHGGGASTEG